MALGRAARAAAAGRRADEEPAREHVALEEIGAQADELGPIGAGKAPLAVFVTEAPDPDYRARGRKTDCSGAFRAASGKPGGSRAARGRGSGKTAGHWQLSGKIAEAKWHRGGEVSLEHEFPPAPRARDRRGGLGPRRGGRVVYSTSRGVARAAGAARAPPEAVGVGRAPLDAEEGARVKLVDSGGGGDGASRRWAGGARGGRKLRRRKGTA